MEFKRVALSVVEEATAAPAKKPREDKWEPVITAVKDLPEGEALAITVEPIPEKELKRVARTMQQNILHAGKRLKFEVQVRIHKEHHTVFVMPKPPELRSNTGGIDTFTVKFGNRGNKIAIVNLAEVADAAVAQTLTDKYEGKPYGPNKSKLTTFLQQSNIAFVEVPQEELPA